MKNNLISVVNKMRILYHGNIEENGKKTFHMGIATPHETHKEEVADIFSDYSDTGLKFDNLGEHRVDGVVIGIYRLKPWENGRVIMTQPVYADINSLREIARTYHLNFIEFKDGSIIDVNDLAEKLKILATEMKESEKIGLNLSFA